MSAPLFPARNFCGLAAVSRFSRVDRWFWSCYGYGLSGLFSELGRALYENVADRDEKDADKGRDGHAKHNRSAHDAARCGTRTLRKHQWHTTRDKHK